MRQYILVRKQVPGAVDAEGRVGLARVEEEVCQRTPLNEERSSLVLGDIRVLGLPGEVPEQKE